MDDKIVISRELAEWLLDDVNDLLGEIADLRGYKHYDNIALQYEKEIAELKAALGIPCTGPASCHSRLPDGTCGAGGIAEHCKHRVEDAE